MQLDSLQHAEKRTRPFPVGGAREAPHREGAASDPDGREREESKRVRTRARFASVSPLTFLNSAGRPRAFPGPFQRRWDDGGIETDISELGKAACSESLRGHGDQGSENLTALRLVSEAEDASHPEVESWAEKMGPFF